MLIDGTVLSRLAANDSRLRYLDLAAHVKGQRLTVEDTLALTSALKENTYVDRLSLVDLLIPPDVEPLLADLLKASKKITTIAMGRSGLGSRQLTLCSAAIREIPTLQRFCCLGGDLNIEAAASLASLIRSSRSLVELDLRDTLIYNDAAMTLVEALKANSSIRVLRINCYGTISTTLAYIDMLSVNTTLDRVEMRLSQLSSLLLHKFGDALKRNHALTSLTIRYQTGEDLLTDAKGIFSELSYFYFSALSQKILIEREPWILKCEAMFHHFISTSRLDLTAINALLREAPELKTAKEHLDADDASLLLSGLHELYIAWFPPDPFEFKFNDCPQYKSLLTVLQHLATSDYYAAALELKYAEERLGFRHELMRTLAPLLQREITMGVTRLPIKRERKITETALPAAASFTSFLRRRHVYPDIGFFCMEEAAKAFTKNNHTHSRVEEFGPYTPHYKVE